MLPDRLIGSVGTSAMAASTSGGPRRVTTDGLAVTVPTSKPAAGAPVRSGRMGTVRLVSTVLTSISTRTVDGLSSTDSTRRPSMSTGTRSTCPQQSIPDGSIRTVASARSTRSRRLCGPLAVTRCTLSCGALISSPGGTSPESMATRTWASSRRSIATDTALGA